MGNQINTLVNGLARSQQQPNNAQSTTQQPNTQGNQPTAQSTTQQPNVQGNQQANIQANQQPNTQTTTATLQKTNNTTPQPYKPPLSKDPPNVVTERFRNYLDKCPKRDQEHVISGFKSVVIRNKPSAASGVATWIIIAIVAFIIIAIAGYAWYKRSNVDELPKKKQDRKVGDRTRRLDKENGENDGDKDKNGDKEKNSDRKKSNEKKREEVTKKDNNKGSATKKKSSEKGRASPTNKVRKDIEKANKRGDVATNEAA